LKDLPVAVILAGGASSRFAPLADKNTLKFLGKTLIEHHLENLNSVGIKDVIVITNPANDEQIKQTLAVHKNVKFAVQAQPKGMGDAILSAENLILDEFDARSIYVLNGDDVIEVEWHSKILREHENEKVDSAIGACQVSSYFPGGYLIVDAENRISSVKEKPGAGNEPSNLINAVAHLHKNSEKLVRYIKKEYTNKEVKTDDHYERAMDKLMKEHYFKAVPYANYQTIKFPWHVLDTMSYFLKKISGKIISSSAQISPHAIIRDNVIIEDGVKIFEGAIVGPNTYLGKNAIVGNHALVRESILNENSVAGYNTEICRSFINDNCWFHMNYVGDSIIDSNVSFGSGAITANLRLDEGEIISTVKGEKVNTKRTKFGNIIGKNVRVTINANLMPGIKIGANCFVGSHVNLDRDLEPGTYCYVKQEFLIKENNRKLPDRNVFRKKLEGTTTK